jgi:hypothetical protein
MKPYTQGAWHRCRARAREFKKVEINRSEFNLQWGIYLKSCKSSLRRFLAGDHGVPALDVFDRISIALSLCSQETRREYWDLSRKALLREFSTPVGLISPIYRSTKFISKGQFEFNGFRRMARRISRDPEGRERLRRLLVEECIDLACAVRIAYLTAVEDPELVHHHSKKR